MILWKGIYCTKMKLKGTQGDKPTKETEVKNKGKRDQAEARKQASRHHGSPKKIPGSSMEEQRRLPTAPDQSKGDQTPPEARREHRGEYSNAQARTSEVGGESSAA